MDKPTDVMMARIRKAPWLDRAGRFAPLKALVFAGLFLPAIATAIQLQTGQFAAEPAKDVEHALGLWTIRLILLSLAVTPAMQIFRWPRLLTVRRMVGVGAFVYVLAHLTAYAAQQNFNMVMVVSEIALRYYLTIGFAALLILAVLAATSTDTMIRRLGSKRWTWLHRIVYLAATLGLIHYFIQAKLIVTEPTVVAGFFIWLMGYRLILWTGGMRVATRPVTLAGLAVSSAALTMLGEAAGFALFTSAPAMLVLEANFTFIAGIRPGWYVLMVGAAIVVAALVRGYFAPAPRRRATVAA